MSSLDSRVIAEQFVKDIEYLQTRWQKLNPDQREVEIEAAIYKLSNSTGLPKFAVEKSKLSPTTYGTFDFQAWKISLNQNLINAPILSNKDTLELAKTIYHEARHGEQSYRIAQLFAGQSRTPQQITNETGIPLDITQEASQVIKAQPLTFVQKAQADAWYQSEYGTRSSYREQVFSKLDQAQKTYNQIVSAYNSATDNGAIAQLGKKLEQAEGALRSAISKYRALPEEADAFNIEPLVEKVYKSPVSMKAEAPSPRLTPEIFTQLSRLSSPSITAQKEAVNQIARLSAQELKSLPPSHLLAAARIVEQWQKTEPRLDFPQGSAQLSKELNGLTQKYANLTEQHERNTKTLQQVTKQGMRSLFNPFGASIQANNEAHANYNTTSGKLERVQKEISQVKTQLGEARSQETTHKLWSENSQTKSVLMLAQKLEYPQLKAEVERLQGGMSYLQQWERASIATGKPVSQIMRIHAIRDDYLQGRPIAPEVVQAMKQEIGQFQLQKAYEKSQDAAVGAR